MQSDIPDRQERYLPVFWSKTGSDILRYAARRVYPLADPSIID